MFSIIKKEFRENYSMWFASLAVVILICGLLVLRKVPPGTYLFCCIWISLPAITLLTASGLFAQEKTNQTYEFLSTLPFSKAQIWCAKTLYGLIVLSCTGLILLGIGFFFEWYTSPVGNYYSIQKAIFTKFDYALYPFRCIPLVLLVFGFSQFLSVLSNKVIVASFSSLLGGILFTVLGLFLMDRYFLNPFVWSILLALPFYVSSYYGINKGELLDTKSKEMGLFDGFMKGLLVSFVLLAVFAFFNSYSLPEICEAKVSAIRPKEFFLMVDVKSAETDLFLWQKTTRCMIINRSDLTQTLLPYRHVQQINVNKNGDLMIFSLGPYRHIIVCNRKQTLRSIIDAVSFPQFLGDTDWIFYHDSEGQRILIKAVTGESIPQYVNTINEQTSPFQSKKAPGENKIHIGSNPSGSMILYLSINLNPVWNLSSLCYFPDFETKYTLVNEQHQEIDLGISTPALNTITWNDNNELILVSVTYGESLTSEFEILKINPANGTRKILKKFQALELDIWLPDDNRKKVMIGYLTSGSEIRREVVDMSSGKAQTVEFFGKPIAFSEEMVFLKNNRAFYQYNIEKKTTVVILSFNIPEKGSEPNDRTDQQNQNPDFQHQTGILRPARNN